MGGEKSTDTVFFPRTFPAAMTCRPCPSSFAANRFGLPASLGAQTSSFAAVGAPALADLPPSLPAAEAAPLDACPDHALASSFAALGAPTPEGAPSEAARPKRFAAKELASHGHALCLDDQAFYLDDDAFMAHAAAVAATAAREAVNAQMWRASAAVAAAEVEHEHRVDKRRRLLGSAQHKLTKHDHRRLPVPSPLPAAPAETPSMGAKVSSFAALGAPTSAAPDQIVGTALELAVARAMVDAKDAFAALGGPSSLPSSSATLLPNGGWHVVAGELIGEGHFARVYAAGADAALKILRDDVRDDVLGKGWYQVLGVPAHPGLVRTLALAEDRRSVLMERGESDLFAALWERSMPGITSPLQIARALLDVGAALRHLHEHGVAHRDVKPENILLRWHNGSGLRAFVTDFDFAVSGRRLPVSHVAGTLKYVPRSQRQMTERYRAACRKARIEGRPAPREPSYSTFASDAYAFTVVVIETLVKDAAWSDCNDSIALEKFLAPLDMLAKTYGPRLGEAVQLCLAIPCDTHQLALERVLSVVLAAAGF